jgi:predicted HD phosphohydrolase
MNGVGLNDLDKLSLIVAALSHDIGHDGFTNAYHKTTQSKRWKNFGDMGVQEGFHAATTILLLEKYNIHSQALTPTSMRLIKKRILVSILDTDMASKKDLETQFQAHLDKRGIKNGANFYNFIDRTTS